MLLLELLGLAKVKSESKATKLGLATTDSQASPSILVQCICGILEAGRLRLRNSTDGERWYATSWLISFFIHLNVLLVLSGHAEATKVHGRDFAASGLTWLFIDSRAFRLFWLFISRHICKIKSESHGRGFLLLDRSLLLLLLRISVS